MHQFATMSRPSLSLGPDAGRRSQAHNTSASTLLFRFDAWAKTELTRPGNHWQSAEYTFPQRLVLKATAEPNVVAMRQKRHGYYRAWTWRDYSEQVCELAAGVKALGFRRGDRLALMGDSRIEMVLLELAAQAAGGITLGIYATSSPKEVEYYLSDSGATIVVAETQEHLDKILPALPGTASIRSIVLLDTRTKFLYAQETVIGYEQVIERGRARIHSYPDEIAEDIKAGNPEDRAIILYTSGTTGRPKGAVHSHRTYFFAVYGMALIFPDACVREHRFVAHLSLAHGVGKMMALFPLISRSIAHFPEEIENFAETIREVAPTLLILVPRYFQKFAAGLLVDIESSSWEKRAAYRAAMIIGNRVRVARWEGRKLSWPSRALYAAARLFVFQPLLDKIGLSRLEYAYTGSAPMPPEVMALWQAWGVDIREVYGQTEAGGAVLAHSRPWPRPGTIGVELSDPRYEVRVAEDGELLVRAPSNFLGYWNNPQATKETFEGEWIKTGDVVEKTSSGYKIIDRKKHFLKTAGGKMISPQQIENAIKGSLYISEAVIIGEGRKYITALLELDFEATSAWARQRDITYASYAALVRHPDVLQLIRSEVERINAQLARVEQIKDFRTLPFELEPDRGDTTASRKIVRNKMEQMFADLIAEMYSADEETSIRQQLGGRVT